jgi:hypothetical protein
MRLWKVYGVGSKEPLERESSIFKGFLAQKKCKSLVREARLFFPGVSTQGFPPQGFPPLAINGNPVGVKKQSNQGSKRVILDPKYVKP